LESKIHIEFETTYVLKEFGGVDAKAAMLDIIANSISMGTSNSRFYVTGSAAGQLNTIMKSMEAGDVDGLFDDIAGALKEIITDVTAKMVKAASGITTALTSATDPAGGADAAIQAVIGNLQSFGSALLKQRYSRYKWPLRGAFGALTGMYTAPWHVTIGNPMAPWFSCGNLVVDRVDMEAGGELAYNDMFTELRVKISLSAGRALGGDELSALFNNGSGRIYDTPDKVQSVYIPQGQSFTAPGITASGSTNSISQSQTAANTPADTDSANALPNTSAFSLNNTDSDNNLNNTNTNSFTGQ
jgi:hypothetical protein